MNTNKTTQAATEKKFENLTKDFENFAYITSHDLTDPLRGALANCEILAAKLSNNENRDTLLLIENDIKHILNKIKILREYSYLICRKIKKDKIIFKDILPKVYEELKEKITHTKAELFEENLPVEIYGFEPYITRIFKELIENALIYKCSKHPQITISGTETDNEWIFSISDNGKGFNPVYKELIFALFQKIDPEQNKEHQGAGLAFVKKIVELHGGKIWFESEEDLGSKFFFSLKKS